MRIVESDDATAAGYAGRLGVCSGFTTPSVTGVEVIGGAKGDLAFNVHFDDELVADAWFRPDLLELVDHGPGTEITIGDRNLVREADGEWRPVEED